MTEAASQTYALVKYYYILVLALLSKYQMYLIHFITFR